MTELPLRLGLGCLTRAQNHLDTYLLVVQCFETSCKPRFSPLCGVTIVVIFPIVCYTFFIMWRHPFLGNQEDDTGQWQN